MTYWEAADILEHGVSTLRKGSRGGSSSIESS